MSPARTPKQPFLEAPEGRSLGTLRRSSAGDLYVLDEEVVVMARCRISEKRSDTPRTQGSAEDLRDLT